MKCPRCKSRGEQNAPNMKVQQNGRKQLYMKCPACGYAIGYTLKK